MKRILGILLLAGMAHANFGLMDSRHLNNIEANTAANTAALNRIAAALEKQNQLLEKLLKKDEPPQPKPVAVENPVSVEIPVSKPAPQYNKFNRDKMFIRPGEPVEESVDEEAENCIKECVEIYESTDKYVIKDCLMEMCGFSITDIYK